MFTVYENLCIMTSDAQVKFKKFWCKDVDQTVNNRGLIHTNFQVYFIYCQWIQTSLDNKNTIMLSMYENTFLKNNRNVVLNFEAKKELSNSSCWNNNFDKAENVNE